MKKIFIFIVAIGMTATILAPEAKAQFSVSPYALCGIDQGGLTNNGGLNNFNPGGGICVQGLENGPISLGLNMNGGMIYRVRIDGDSSKTTYKKVNAPALTAVIALNVRNKIFDNLFAGPIVGVEGGVAFPNNVSYSGPAGVVKVFTQLNLGGDVGDYHLSFFAQGSFNFLYMNQTTYASALAVGLRFSVPRYH